jgi:hypothetical protein
MFSPPSRVSARFVGNDIEKERNSDAYEPGLAGEHQRLLNISKSPRPNPRLTNYSWPNSSSQ